MTFTGCEGMATLFHGVKPKAPISSYTIIFNANGATEGAPPPSQTVTVGTNISIDIPGDLTYPGEIFSKWNPFSDPD
jgi:hypothetical protein